MKSFVEEVKSFVRKSYKRHFKALQSIICKCSIVCNPHG
nr:MAG TPA: hypothetical protein [Bacteriophage sp.]